MTTNLAVVYQQAADVIRANGHYKGAYWGRPETGVGIEYAASECPVCAVGALSVAVTGSPVPQADEVDPVIIAFASRMFGPVNAEAAVVRLAAWNDAPERTPDDVIAALENAAKPVAA
ncbi:DUF6197 family protein [Streptomyces sp. NPDC054871]